MLIELSDDVVTVSRFFLQAEDGIRDLVRSRGLGDVYKRQVYIRKAFEYARTLTKKKLELRDSGFEFPDYGPKYLSLIHI